MEKELDISIEIDLVQIFRNMSKEKQKEFINLIIEAINKKVAGTTFLEQYHNSLKAIGDKPLSVQ